MATSKTKTISINDQLVAITQRAAKVRSSLDANQAGAAVEGIKELENSLSHVSEILISFEQRFGNLQALAGIDDCAIQPNPWTQDHTRVLDWDSGQ